MVFARRPGDEQETPYLASSLPLIEVGARAQWSNCSERSQRTSGNEKPSYCAPLTYSASLVYCRRVVFIESPIFTADVKELLSDEEYAALQKHLAHRPDAGVLITQTGGLRKVRWRAEGSGKRGGVRVIYYHVIAQAQIRMILIYRKGVKDDLTQREKAVLSRINAEW